MAKEGQPGRLEAIATAASHAGSGGIPPVDQWHPQICGDVDIYIGPDGTWYYQQSPIMRPALVRLFASILTHEDDRYYLVTPVEKCGIKVADVPFVAVDVAEEENPEGKALRFRTNVDDEVLCGPDHALRFERQPNGGLKPYIHVRRNLWARATRPVYYDLAEKGEPRMVDGKEWFGVVSRGAFFPMVPVVELEDALREDASK